MSDTRKIKTPLAGRKMLCLLFALTALGGAGCTSAQAQAAMIPIELNANTTNSQALSIAKDVSTLDNDAREYGDSEIGFYAAYVPLDPSNPQRFIGVMIDSVSFCTANGCAYEIYEDRNYNQHDNGRVGGWVKVADIFATSVAYDTQSERVPYDIVTESGTIEKSVYELKWNGQRYKSY